MTKNSTLKLIVAGIFCFYLQNANAAFPVASSKAENTAVVAKNTTLNTLTTEKEALAKTSVTKQEAKKVAKEAKKALKAKDGGGKSQVIALILAIIIGGLGIHRFYLGYTWQGVVQLLTAGGCGIWALIDIIRIITGDLQPKNGPYDKTL